MKTLFILAAAICAIALPARAMYVNPDGTGQALIFPYFTAQPAGGNPFNTYVSIANRDGLDKALRVRFREGRNGREVASFNLYLRANDLWTGAVVPTSLGTVLVTQDESCTRFYHDFSASPPTLPFSNAAYTGANADSFGSDPERMAEGYIEVMEMASLLDHDSCIDRVNGLASEVRQAPRGHLSGTLTLINVLDGTDFTVNAVALQDVASSTYFRADASTYPDWDAEEINRVGSFVQDGKLYLGAFPSGVGALDMVLMQASVNNEIVLDAPTASTTDWVFTLPSKRFHTGATVTPPFTPGLREGRDIPLYMNFATREGAVTQYVDGCGFLCPGNTTEADVRLRWASTVVTFRAGSGPGGPGISDTLGSRNSWAFVVPAGVRNGSAQVGFGGIFGSPELPVSASSTRISDGVVAPESLRMQGLPVLGFMVRTFHNGTLTCTGASCQGNYGGSFPHKYTRRLAP